MPLRVHTGLGCYSAKGRNTTAVSFVYGNPYLYLYLFILLLLLLSCTALCLIIEPNVERGICAKSQAPGHAARPFSDEIYAEIFELWCHRIRQFLHPGSHEAFFGG